MMMYVVYERYIGTLTKRKKLRRCKHPVVVFEDQQCPRVRIERFNSSREPLQCCFGASPLSTTMQGESLRADKISDRCLMVHLSNGSRDYGGGLGVQYDELVRMKAEAYICRFRELSRFDEFRPDDICLIEVIDRIPADRMSRQGQQLAGDAESADSEPDTFPNRIDERGSVRKNYLREIGAPGCLIECRAIAVRCLPKSYRRVKKLAAESPPGRIRFKKNGSILGCPRFSSGQRRLTEP